MGNVRLQAKTAVTCFTMAIRDCTDPDQALSLITAAEQLKAAAIARKAVLENEGDELDLAAHIVDGICDSEGDG